VLSPAAYLKGQCVCVCVCGVGVLAATEDVDLKEGIGNPKEFTYIFHF